MSKFTINDNAYKYLFSDPLILKELLESFVNMDWVKEIDYSKAHTVNKSYINEYCFNNISF